MRDEPRVRLYECYVASAMCVFLWCTVRVCVLDVRVRARVCVWNEVGY